MVAADEESFELAERLRPILLRLARHLREATRKEGLTGGQVAILVAIEFHPGITSQQLARREGLSASAASGHLARLEGHGMIRRERTRDGRSVGLHLTDVGNNVLSTVRESRTLWLAGQLARLADEERRAIRGVLEVLDRVSMGER